MRDSVTGFHRIKGRILQGMLSINTHGGVQVYGFSVLDLARGPDALGTAKEPVPVSSQAQFSGPGNLD